MARLLQMLAPVYGVPHPQGTKLRVNFTHGEIGDMVGATRPWVCQAFSKLQQAGALRIAENHHIVLDLPALDAFLASSDKDEPRRGRTRSQRTAERGALVKHIALLAK